MENYENIGDYNKYRREYMKNSDNILERLTKERDTLFNEAQKSIDRKEEEKRREEERKLQEALEIRRKIEQNTKSLAQEIGGLIYSVLSDVRSNGSKQNTSAREGGFPGLIQLHDYRVNYEFKDDELSINLDYAHELAKGKALPGLDVRDIDRELLTQILEEYGISIKLVEAEWANYFGTVRITFKNKEKERTY